MKPFFPCLVNVAIIQLFAISISSAQSSKSSITALQAPPAKIMIDGDIKEWGDSLRYYNAEKKINYSIANTKDTLYMAIRINNRSEQKRILMAGITFTVDPKGKKKEDYSITFPLNVHGVSNPLAGLHGDDAPGDITKQERDELIREKITNLRGIKVTGFKEIEDEMITTSNTYGIQAAINYDDNGYLVCEAAIPLKFFHVDDLAKNEWSFNFKINGIQKPEPTQSSGDEGSSSGGRGGRGGSMGGGGGHGGHGGRGGGSHSNSGGGSGNSELSKSEDFWGKFYLAK